MLVASFAMAATSELIVVVILTAVVVVVVVVFVDVGDIGVQVAGCVEARQAHGGPDFLPFEERRSALRPNEVDHKPQVEGVESEFR